MSVPRSLIRPAVAVAATEPETLLGITAYLDAAGIASAPYTDISEVGTASDDTLVFVLFPDAFPWEAVVAALEGIRAHHGSALPVIVTSTPHRYEALTFGERVLVVPRPAWGWSVLDGIRFHIAHARRACDAMAAAS